MNRASRFIVVLLLLVGLTAVLPVGAAAQVAAENNSVLGSLSFMDESLMARPSVEMVDDIQGSIRSSVASSWAEFRNLNGEWNASVDKRTGLVEFVEGSGLPWIPGHGNNLVTAMGTNKPDLATLESISRSFLPRVAPMLGVDIKSLKMDVNRSGSPSDYLWYVDFNVERDGMVVDGARVIFRVNHGNLIQFGTENLPAPGTVVPKAKLTRNQALSVVSDYIGGFNAADTFVDGGSQRLLPINIADSRFNDGFELGKGRGLTRIWQFVFRRDGDHATWRARVDATSGKILEFRDINEYAAAQVTGGAKFLGVAQTRPMPFANVSSGGFTNSAGVYNYTSGTVTSTLAGQYVRITDNCGAISQSSGTGGNILFGTSAGNNCTTPGSGGAGNTHSARTQFYHVNRAKEIARGWITRTWLTNQLTANVNINLTCNAFWNGSTINFYRSGGGCGNTGEIEGVSLHEYGHGLDTNDGSGSSPDNGTGETYGDFTAALATHTSCVGSGFLGSNCGGYGDACTSCTGVRDIDYAKHVSNAPYTVGNFTQTKCPAGGGYNGPCAQEGHCESLVPSQALWDLANRDLPSPGSGAAWSTVDRLWYLSRATATGAFTCVKTTSPWTSNGCGAGSLWKTMRAVDDDDGNLTNGTPNSASLYAAFNRHGIACTTDAGANTNFRGCTQPAVPTISLTPGDNQVTVNISGSTGVYDVYRTENGCNSGFIKDTNDSASTSVVDTDVANGFTYYYQVKAHPSGNEACASAPSTCLSVVPAGTVTPDFSISASPTSVSVVQGNSGNSTISTSALNGFNSAISLSASGAPAGVTVSFSPTSIAAPGTGSSTMTMAVGASTAVGTYTITVTGIGGSLTHTTTVTLNVTTTNPPQQLLGNPGFETGTATPWVATTGVIDNTASQPARTGSWKAWLNGYGTTHTDTLYQQVTIPSTVTSATLNFYLHIDSAETTTVTAYDTLRVQIRNSSNTVLATLATYSNLNKAAGYSLKTFNLNAYIGQTIRVYFLGVEDSSLQTSFVIDDTALNVQ